MNATGFYNALPNAALSDHLKAHSFVLSHTINLLGNFPLHYLDVLLLTKIQQDSIMYMGVNMDAVNMLLEFMEKRLDRVSQHSISILFQFCCFSFFFPGSVSETACF